MSDDLTLKIGGQAISGWQEVRVTRGIERVVSDFEVAMTERYPGVSDVALAPGQPCEVFLGDDLVITGYVDRYIPAFDAHQHTVRVCGRGKLQDMVDCAAVWPNGQVVNGTLADIASKLLTPFGISVIALSDTGAPIPKQVLNIGDTVFDVLEPIARYRALLMYEDVSGDLIFSSVGTSKAASGFVEGRNVEAATAIYSMDQRFSDYGAFRVKVAAFGDSGNEANLITDVQDTAVPRYRPKFLVAETNDGGFDVAKRRAQWEMVRRAGRSAGVHVLTDGWRDQAGVLWTPNTLAVLELPTLKMPRVQWLISEVTYRRGASGTHAQLTLMHPDSFIPQPTVLQPFPNALAQALDIASGGGR